jgi:membrane protein involved in colicin uptake
MNLKIEHAIVGQFRGGQVVPVAAVEGGRPEAERLVALRAMSWTEAEPTEAFPASGSAVAEMPDDELAAENARLKAELEAAKAARADAVTSAKAEGRAELEGEVARLTAELEAAKAATPADPAPPAGGKKK